MKKLSQGGRRWLKGIHVLIASIWVGTGVSMNVLIAMRAAVPNGDELFAVNNCIKLLDDYVIIPAAMTCLFTGLLISLFTNWGFFKYHWVTVKWIATLALIIFGTIWLGPWTNANEALANELRAGALAAPEYIGNRNLLLIFGPVQIVVLFFLIVISSLKPWGARKASSTKENP